jgi:hypothetical protein
MPRDEETVDRIFAGIVDGIPPLSSKVDTCMHACTAFTHRPGGADLHQLHLYRHVDGEEHADGVCLPEDQRVLQGETRAGVPGQDDWRGIYELEIRLFRWWTCGGE